MMLFSFGGPVLGFCFSSSLTFFKYLALWFTHLPELLWFNNMTLMIFLFCFTCASVPILQTITGIVRSFTLLFSAHFLSSHGFSFFLQLVYLLLITLSQCFSCVFYRWIANACLQSPHKTSRFLLCLFPPFPCQKTPVFFSRIIIALSSQPPSFETSKLFFFQPQD